MPRDDVTGIVFYLVLFVFIVSVILLAWEILT